MYSVICQDKTALRDGRGGTVYRRLYLCDGETDLTELPTEDAPGSGAMVIGEGSIYLLDHSRRWQKSDLPAGVGGVLWKS